MLSTVPFPPDANFMKTKYSKWGAWICNLDFRHIFRAAFGGLLKWLKAPGWEPLKGRGILYVPMHLSMRTGHSALRFLRWALALCTMLRTSFEIPRNWYRFSILFNIRSLQIDTNAILDSITWSPPPPRNPSYLNPTLIIFDFLIPPITYLIYPIRYLFCSILCNVFYTYTEWVITAFLSFPSSSLSLDRFIY